MVGGAEGQDQGWREFIAGDLYPDTAAPWATDPAFALVLRFPGLRDSVGGRVAAALRQTIGLVRAVRGVELLAVVQANRPALGLCLGFGMNVLEPYDLLQTFRLDQVHAYEWIGEQVIEAAQALQALRAAEPLLPTQIRLHHGTISDLRALADGSIHVAYVANVFTAEVPMGAETFTAAVGEILRVLAKGGILISRGSAGTLEAALRRVVQPLLETALVSVFQKI
ncbi:MAG: methyltransferase domain-containing protein [Candidatus Binatia bacterium]|nr:methyltransferase domain-containing protein [Candidatus Binatia bacterium]